MARRRLYTSIDYTFVFLPLLLLKELRELRYGRIGPASLLAQSFSVLNDFLPALQHVSIDGTKITDPILAVSSSDHAKFRSEIEVIKYMILRDHFDSSVSIFESLSILIIHHEALKKLITIDEHVTTLTTGLISINSNNYSSYSDEYMTHELNQIASTFDTIMCSDLLQALMLCVENKSDSDKQREANRIIVAVSVMNRISIELNDPTSNTQVLLLAAAFEALLNLPSEAKVATFQHAVTTLTGESSRLMNRWCREFYNYRSALTHGDVLWNSDRATFGVHGDDGPPHSFIAARMLEYCLEVKLFLMGLLPRYHRRDLDFEALVSLNKPPSQPAG